MIGLELRLQRVGKRLPTGETLLGVLAQAPIESGRHSRRHVRRHREQRRGWCIHMLDEDRGRRRPGERHLARERVEADTGQAVEITTRVDRGALGLLGAHELGRAHDLRRGLRLSVLCDHGDAEVGDHRPARFLVQQDVVRLHVPVHHALQVRMTQRPRHFAQQTYGTGVRERAALPDAVPERPAIHVGHGEEDEVVRLIHRIDLNDVRVREPGGGAGLLEEALLHCTIATSGDSWQGCSIGLPLFPTRHRP